MRLRISKLSWTLLATLSLVGVTWAYAPVESRQGGANARGAAPDVAQIQKLEFLQQEVQELRGKVEELTYQLQQQQEQQKKLYLDLEKRLGEKKTSNTSTSLDNGISFDELENQPSAPTAAKPALQSSSSNNEEKAYRLAYQHVQNRNLNKAVPAFQSFIKDYPHGKYLPNAHYWLGEIYLNKGELDLAAENFSLVYQKYVDHPKAPDALLKLGYVKHAKGKYADSKELLNQVKSQFPGTTSAQLADTRLQKLRQEGRI